ncbi:hypothetical protein NON08_12735 [Cetobacterium somerae]|uniref:hypothetical protein n=1 Tax=Cetobacterium sp. NK01 TaxID=2993530 RepID=UPI0021168B08|nr:hypothetical protein [Cetobacterium sp. NK01]MCQ8213367.1 hypothetical protein [Cetobacterium sp. NK01]
MSNKATEIFSNNLQNKLIEGGIPFSAEISKVFSEVALGSVENITNMMDKSDERRHKEILKKIENDFKETELFSNFSKAGLDITKEVLQQCLKFYENALESCKDLEKELSIIITNINEDKDIRMKAMEENTKLKQTKINSTNDLTKTAVKAVTTLTAIVAATFISKKGIDSWENSKKPFWKR